MDLLMIAGVEIDADMEFIAEAAPVRIHIEERRTPDGVSRWWSECDADAFDAIVGASPEETTARVLARITKIRGASA